MGRRSRSCQSRITVAGTNDDLILAAATSSGAVVEDVLATSASGAIAFTDADLTDTHTVSAVPAAGGYLGDFAVSIANGSAGGGTGQVTWNFNVANADLQFLAAGQTRTQIYMVTIEDGEGGAVSQAIAVTITGTNDGPTINASDPTGFIEALNASAQNLGQNGTVSFDDIDSNDVVDITFASNGLPVWSHGSLDPALRALLVAGFSTGAIDAAARVRPESYNATANLDFLGADETITFSYTVTATDGSGASASDVVSFTITGTNDGPTIAASDPTGFIEAPNASAQNLVRTARSASTTSTATTWSTLPLRRMARRCGATARLIRRLARCCLPASRPG